MALEMARLRRRAWLAAGATVLVARIARKLALAEQASAQGVDMHPLRDIVLAKPPVTPPPVSFTTLDGGHRNLADFAGRPVVLNFWATWCVPCVAELPELDRLAASGRITVLAVSADRGGAAVVKPFIAAHGITHATVLLDSGSDAAHALQVVGFPTTLLIAPDGRLHGRLEGPAAWGGAADAIEAILRG